MSRARPTNAERGKHRPLLFNLRFPRGPSVAFSTALKATIVLIVGVCSSLALVALGGSDGMTEARAQQSRNARFLSSAEIFSQHTRTFTRLESTMTQTRQYPVAATLGSGNVLIAGGFSNRSAEVFEPNAPGFRRLSGQTTESRWGAAAAPFPGTGVLIAGGFSGYGRASVENDTVEVFNQGAGQFRQTAVHLTQPRVEASATALTGGRILIAGGATEGTEQATVEIFSPKRGRFVRLRRQMSEARLAPVAAPLPGGKVLIAGGHRSHTSSLDSAEVLDPKTGWFRRLPARMTEPRQGAAAARLPNGQILIVGNKVAGDVSAELFDPNTERFTRVRSRLTEPRWMPIAALLSNGDILIAGGAAP